MNASKSVCAIAGTAADETADTGSGPTAAQTPTHIANPIVCFHVTRNLRGILPMT
jgi:hypothetical protein